MSLCKRRLMIGGAAAALLLASQTLPAQHADIRIEFADRADLAPQTFHAAVEVGKIAISVLITWTSRL